MDTRELNIYEALSATISEYMKGVYTAIPAHVVTFDPNTQTAQIELGIQRVNLDGSTETPPPITDVPVLFNGCGFVAEFQIDSGCEGLAVFSQRCIDGWLNQGGCAPNPLARFHAMEDAFFIAGFRPISGVVSGFSNNGIKLRNQSGNQFAWLKNDGSIELKNGSGYIKLASNGVVTINGVAIDTGGNVTTAAQVTATTIVGTSNVTFAGISGKGHVHNCGDHDTGTPK